MSKKILLLVRPNEPKFILESKLHEQFSDHEIYATSVSTFEETNRLLNRTAVLLDEIGDDRDHTALTAVDADRVARQTDAELAFLRNRLGITQQISYGWEYLNLGVFLYGYKRVAELSRYLVAHLPAGASITALQAEDEADFSLDCKYYKELILEQLATKFKQISVIKYQAGVSLKEAYSGSLSVPDGDFDVLCHLPTCFYDAEEHYKRITSRALKTLDVQAAYWDVVLSTTRAVIDLTLTVAHEPVHELYLSKYRDILVSNLAFCVEKNHLDGIVDRYTQRARFQVAALDTLRDSHALNNTRLLEISDHDAGLHGPMISFASERAMGIHVYPHSGFVFNALPIGAGSTSMRTLKKHKSFSRIGHHEYSHHQYLHKKEHKGSGRNWNKVLVILNEAEDGAQVPMFRLNEYTRALDLLISLLETMHKTVAVRFKPVGPLDHLWPRSVLTAKGDKSHWVEWADLCIGVGIPSSLITECCLAGLPCYQACGHTLSEGELCLLHDDVKIVGPGNYLELVSKIVTELAD